MVVQLSPRSSVVHRKLAPLTAAGCSADKEVRLVAGGLTAGVGLWPHSAVATLQEISALSSSPLRMAEG